MLAQPFRDNVIILTGASMGIGEHLAYQLADQGAKLVLAARSVDRLEAIAEKCRLSGTETLVVPVDLTNQQQCKSLITQTLDKFGRIDSLLYNAGRGFPKRFADLTDLSTLQQEMNLNFMGLVYCAHYALPHIIQRRGRIIGVSSFNAFVGMAGTIGYNSSKHAMRGFLNTLRVELRGTGVSVTLVYPGAVHTARLDETLGNNISKVPLMSPERCGELIIQAAGKRRRQLILTAAGKLLVWFYRIAPSLVEPQLARIADLYVET
jgi:short-subunit dehydrogenase